MKGVEPRVDVLFLVGMSIFSHSSGRRRDANGGRNKVNKVVGQLARKAVGVGLNIPKNEVHEVNPRFSLHRKCDVYSVEAVEQLLLPYFCL